MVIKDLIVAGDWVLLVFSNCSRIFNFARGFTEEDSIVIQHGEVTAANQGKISA